MQRPPFCFWLRAGSVFCRISAVLGIVVGVVGANSNQPMLIGVGFAVVIQSDLMRRARQRATWRTVFAGFTRCANENAPHGNPHGARTATSLFRTL